MTVKEFYDYMCRQLPSELSLDGDADGLSCCPDPEREVKTVLIALDATDSVIDEAVEDGYDVILTHHPMLFGGVDSVVSGEYRGNKLIKLIRAGISTMAFHTRLDSADGGVNDILAGLIGLCETERFGEKGIGRIGRLKTPMFAENFAEHIKSTLGCPYVEFSDCGRLISRVAVVGGSANSELDCAIAEKADALVGGELRYHSLCDSPDFGISLFAAGHFFTENPVCSRLFEYVVAAGAEPTITFSNRIGAV